ncbi:MAG: ETC complex I subunit [Proteobacteria bacterium]|nr:ETC complex I subunit [Pseudomonadota bacterium]
MTTVRIYQPSKSAMQSGKKNANEWRVGFEPFDPLMPEPLMGWISSKDMSQELDLRFSSLDEALQFVRLKGFDYVIHNPTQVSIVPKSYESNFTCPRIRGS